MTRQPSTSLAPSAAAIQAHTAGDVCLLRIAGLVDERFAGFGAVGQPKTLVMEVSGITRMTSFGVRQWIAALDTLPKSIAELYFVGCPTFFIDQLNMVVNFGGRAKVITAFAPYACPLCGNESLELIDVLAGRGDLVRSPPERDCGSCGNKMELDETPEAYFAFVATFGATSIDPAAAELLADKGLYTSDAAATEKPPRITKLVHGPVTYFRVKGTVGAMFRARPFLVGSEGEVVIDLADVDRFTAAGEPEWRRLLKALGNQASSTTIVDVPPSLLDIAGTSLGIGRNLAVASLLAPYTCNECGRTSQVSVPTVNVEWPLRFGPQVCATCGGAMTARLSQDALQPLRKVSTRVSPAAAKIVEHRTELLSRALADAAVARAGAAKTGLEGQKILGKYEIERSLSAGGMAEVFLAKQVGLDKPVAIKRIQSKMLEQRAQAIELFLNEAKIAGRLTHPGIAQVLDVGEVGGSLFIAMEYVHGKDLRDLIKELAARGRTLPLELVCFIGREIAEALDYAYWSTDLAGKQLAVVHRDVSPHNVIVGYEGTVKLIDFGVAMSAITDHTETLLVGKWTYIAPETVSQVPDHRSDLFSLGIVLYLMCTAKMPFMDPDPKVIFRKMRAGAYAHLDEIAPHVSPALAHLVGRLLSPDPAQRPQRGREVAHVLNEIMRSYAPACSATQLADFIRATFAEATAAPPAPDVVQLVRTDVNGDQTIRDMTRVSGDDQHSITPSAQTSGGRQSQNILPVPRPTPSVTMPPPPPMTPSVAQFAARPSRVQSTPRTTFRDVLVAASIGLGILAVLAVVTYFMFIKD